MLRDHIRKDAHTDQLSLERQGIDLDLTVPEALGHLLAGHVNADGEHVGIAYYEALQHIIDWSVRPHRFRCVLQALHVLRAHGRRTAAPRSPRRPAAARLPVRGPPEEIPFHVPPHMDGHPAIGRLPLAKAEPLADAYAAVLDRMDNAFTP
ncbi:hypothetical protein ACH4RA_04945 [Streptomyces smyrnaeus]|uniref:DUF7691 family protein n=1 Tax=Streptomyces smyrnaeus TaxID=1387713 RepID=UPI0037AE1E17